MNPKLLISFEDEMTATILEQELSSCHIDCVVQKEAKTYDVMFDHGSFCFTLYVDDKDFTRAKEILDQFNKKRDEELPWCPKCGSEDITRIIVHHEHGPKELWFLLPSPLAAPLFFDEYDVKEFHCNSCGHDWKRY